VSLQPFETQAAAGAASAADLALALAAEFDEIDECAADEELHALACGLRSAVLEDASAQFEALAATAEDFIAVAPVQSRDDLRLDRVLERRRGHPAVVAVALSEAAARAGFFAGVVSDGRSFMLAQAGRQSALVLDLGPGAVREPSDREHGRLTWRCAHQLAFTLLAEVVEVSMRSGDLARALRAAELRLALPLADETRQKVEDELRRLAAQLN